MKTPIYMDCHATTPVDPRALACMLPYFSEHFGNPASRSHAFGWRAEEAVEVARRQVADLLGADAVEIVFTSGATEANQLALVGTMEAYAQKGCHLITQATEHKTVLDVCGALQRRHHRVTYLPTDAFGRVDPAQVQQAITPQTVLVSVMLANNEVGTVQALADVGAVCRAAGVLLHTDAAQGAGKISLDMRTMPVDMVSMSAHKMYGPKGVGALYMRRRNPRVTLQPQTFGGGHEHGMRAGTLNVPGIVGFGEACQLAHQEGRAEQARVGALRDALYQQISTGLPDVFMNGHPSERLAGNLSVSFAGIEGQALMLALRDVAVSSGSACASAMLAPSHVLQALGVTDALALSTLRFGLGRFTTRDEVDYVAQLVVEKGKKLRALNRTYNPLAQNATVGGEQT